MLKTQQITLFMTLLLFAVCCLSCHHDDDEQATSPARPANAMTLHDVRTAKITSLIGQEILLYENIAWDNAIGANMECPYLLFEETESRIEIYSSDLTRKLRENSRIEIYYHGRALKRKKTYYMQGAFHYSTRLIQPQPIEDQEFIDFVNDPIHWDDMFEFRLTGLSETPPQ